MNQHIALLGLIVLLGGLLTGCGTPVPQATEPSPTATPTEAALPTEAPTEAPTEVVTEPPPPPPTAVETGGGAIALRITGHVGTEMGWSEEEVRAMDTITVQSTNRQGQLEHYTGVPISALLALAAPAADATTLTYVAADGVTAEAALADVLACADCIVSFRSQGGFSIVMPNFPSNVQVKGVIEIQVQ